MEHRVTNKVSFFVNDKFMGQGTFQALFVFMSQAMFCPSCGRIWARAITEGSENNWYVDSVPCEKCPPSRKPYTINGSLLWWSFEEIPEHFPDSLVEREFFIHVAHLRRSLGNG